MSVVGSDVWQNAAARFITGVGRCEHIVPALHQLHWLPVRRRVDFKISTLVSFIGWHRSYVPSWWMYAGYRHWPPSSAVCWQSNVLGQEVMPPVQWLLFCHRQAHSVEQSAWTASTTGHHLRTIQTIVENVRLVSWAVAPCVWTFRALTRNHFTNLLTKHRLIFCPPFTFSGCFGFFLPFLHLIVIPSDRLRWFL